MAQNHTPLNMNTLGPGPGPYASPTQYRTPLEEFKHIVQDCTRESVIHEQTRPFILVNRLSEWYQRPSNDDSKNSNAGRLLRAVYRDNDPPNLIQDLLAAIEPGHRCWLKVFTILMNLGKGEYIGQFWDSNILDRRLPITEDDLHTQLGHIFPYKSDEENREFARHFFHFQYRLCTIDLLDAEGGRVFGPEAILPVCRKEPIKPNSPTKIFQIEVPCECIPNHILEKVRVDPHKREDHVSYHEFALKILDRRQDYVQEKKAYRALKNQEGIVQCLGSWELKLSPDQSEFYLLLEYGNFDLDEYFENIPPPSLPHDIMRFWEKLTYVAIALDNIHNMGLPAEDVSSPTLYYGWHCDIKPENILFCEGSWKIADPGLAQLVRKEKAVWNDDNLPVIDLKGSTAAYGPPEQACEPKQKITQRFDIWSLGCVFSEAATWLILGNRGVEQFRFVRKSVEIGNRGSISLTDVRGEECFHNKETISEAVIEWHVYLKQSLRAQDRITGSILSLLEKRMLLPSAKDRVSSKELVQLLQSALKRAQKSKTVTEYRPPAYFKVAFYAEQRKIGEEWSKSSTNTAPRKSNRYKSTRFQQSLETVPTAGGISSYDKSSIHAPLLTTSFSDEVRREDLTSQHWPNQSNSGHQELSLMTTGSPMALGAQKRQPSPYGEPEDTQRFDFWDALKLLESQGWEYKSPLQRRVEAPSKDVAASYPVHREDRKMKQSEMISPGTRTPTHKTHGSKSSTLRQFFKRSTKNEDVSAVQSPNRRLSTLAIPPSIDGRLTMKPKSMEQYKIALYDEFFQNRDVVFLLDNGSTMEEHWHRIRELVAVMVALLYGQDDNGMELYFTSSAQKYGPFTEPHQFVETINQMRPNRPKQNAPRRGSTSREIDTSDDIREVLFDILNLVGKDTYKRKLTLIIFTDGIWKSITDKRTVADGIVNRLQRWEDRATLKQMVEARDISLQFVQLGDDDHATMEFEYLDNHLAKPDGTPLPDIIDVEHATGNIKKMILGSLSDAWDGPTPPTIASDDSHSRYGPADYINTGFASGAVNSINSTAQNPYRHYSHLSGESSDLSQTTQSPDYNPSQDILMSGAQFNTASPTSSRLTPSPSSPYTPSPTERGVQPRNRRSRGASQYNSYHDRPDS